MYSLLYYMYSKLYTLVHNYPQDGLCNSKITSRSLDSIVGIFPSSNWPMRSAWPAWPSILLKMENLTPLPFYHWRLLDSLISPWRRFFLSRRMNTGFLPSQKSLTSSTLSTAISLHLTYFLFFSNTPFPHHSTTPCFTIPPSPSSHTIDWVFLHLL